MFKVRLFSAWIRRLTSREALDFWLVFLAGVVAELGLPPDPNPVVAVVGLAIFLRLLDNSSPRRGAWLGFCFGLGHFTFGQVWLWTSLHTYGKLPVVAAMALMLGLAAILSLYFALFGSILPRLATRPWLLPLAAPAGWVVIEWLRAHLFSGFPWNLIGYVWDGAEPWVQNADLGGVYLLSWLTLFLASVVAVLARPGGLKPDLLLVGLSLIVGVLGLSYIYGHYRLAALELQMAGEIWTPPVRIAMIQGNIAQDLKWDPGRQEEWLNRYLHLSADLDKPADLVVWPETAAAFFLQAAPKELAQIADLSRGLGAPILTGAPMVDRDEKQEWRFSNSMVMIGAGESGRFRHRYDKHHLVPFGEYIPMRSWAPDFLHKLTHGTKDFTPGGQPKPMEWGLGAIGALICYEVIFPDEVRLLAVQGAKWLINITNDGWFGDTAKPQHLAMARMRAVENRLPMIRVANSGISATFNHLGQELGRIDPNHFGAKVLVVARGTGQSVWVRTGRYWIWLWLGLCMISWLLVRSPGVWLKKQGVMRDDR